MSITTENTFETALVQSLIEQGGYTVGNVPDYSHDWCMFKFEVIKFHQKSHSMCWEKMF
ncbi:MAG: type restriction enzyme subunit [Bacteroidales bacterium]|jgi:type I restriction enzyme R subunit|nr:type restriction enzyme subunit [Bacteroidales bacterium]